VHVSRLANPLFNEVIVPMARKDEWNADKPHNDSDYASLVNRPELGRLLPFLYPNTFENLEDYNKPRADLNAILLTGIPPGVIDGFQNYTGPVEADMLRLNVAIEPTENPRRSVCWRPTPTRPASRTGAASSTTWSPSSCVPSPG